MKGLFDTDEPSLQPSGRRPSRRDKAAGFPQALRSGSTTGPTSRLPIWSVKAGRHQSTISYQIIISHQATITYRH